MPFVPPVYVPNSAVKIAHSIPRLNLQEFTFNEPSNVNSFTLNGDYFNDAMSDPSKIMDATEATYSAERNYLVGITSLPVALMVIGLVSIFIFQLILFLRCCCKCVKCAPDEDDIAQHPEKVIKSRNRVVWGFWLFLLIMIAADNFLYFGNDELEKGAVNIVKSAKTLRDIFTNLIAETANMVSQVGIMETIVQAIANNNCGDVSAKGTEMQAMQDAVTAMSGAFATINGILQPVPGFLNSAVDYTEKYGQEMKTMALYYLYAFVLAIGLLFLAGSCYSSKWVLFLTTFIGEVVCLFSTVIGGFFMIIVTVYADFCYDPSGNLSSAVPGSSSQDMATYYSTCVGTDPFDSYLTEASNGVTDFSTEFGSTFDTMCFSNHPEYTANVAAAAASISSSLSQVSAQTDCEPIYMVYNQFLNQGICDNTFTGMWNVWLSVCVTSISLYFLMCFSSVMWQYFGVAWKLRPDNVHTGNHLHLVGTHLVPTQPAATETPAHGYKQEYTFTAASPNAPVLTRHDIEMI